MDATEAFTIAEFCKNYRISKSYFYLLRRQGLTPLEVRFGRKAIILRKAAEEWAKKRMAVPQNNGENA